MVDIHSHILPMVDDGARSWEVAIEMVKIAERDGTTHMVATPHANYEYKYDRESHTKLLAELQGKVGDGIKLILGCDFHFSFDNIEDAVAHPTRYAIGDTRYMLIELSDFSIAPQMPNMIYSLTSKGLVPILTHPERNPILQNKPEKVREWAEMGVLVQVTASAFVGKWGRGVQKLAHWYAEQGLLHVIASDAHSLNHRNPVLSEARKIIAKTYGEDLARAVSETNPMAIVTNQHLPEM
ncbi:PHP-like phosphoesterase [Candidatus Koribacter versatilis Ellin345]|uniref:protein-tyrosine-phosphatase n=1 Tax=Koribacter versatilis (strain Ellin345) TaxID=204669 RepID=Q1IS73_KORVE|nr:CpsB/CapC family capsule biosynthesis tyrosine phosphatase [Candidatus Koribacter versatilis]ABF40277.1 PHP-like phosphoesterase [Candidatus Koribacter versatilis Ellin345]